MYPVILVVGQAGSGKDTVADVLTRKMGGTKIALADPIKEFLQMTFPFSKEQLWGPSELRTQLVKNPHYGVKFGFDDFVWNNENTLNWVRNTFGTSVDTSQWYAEFVRPHQFVSARQLLQTLGTEVGRAKSPNIWIDLAVERAEEALKTTNAVIISDGRFKNEVLAVKKLGGVAMRIDGETSLTSSHQSETESLSIPNFWFDIIVENNKSGLEELEEKMDFVVDNLTFHL
jgi:hypothetical protein